MRDEYREKLKTKKKSDKKRRWALLIIVLAFISFTVIKSDIFHFVDSDNGKVEAYIVINCHNLWKNNNEALDKKEKAYLIPDKGQILKKEKYIMKKGETAFDLLKKATIDNKIHTDYKFVKAYDNYYVKGINNLYEFDGGKESGWQYYVNQKYMNYGASNYNLKDGDVVYWVYTCNGGKDIDFEQI